MALTTIGRQLLGEPGLALDYGTYAQAVAALGAARATWSSRAWGPQQDLCWTPRQFRKRAGHLDTSAPLRWLLRRGSDWRKQVAATPGARLLLPTWEFGVLHVAEKLAPGSGHKKRPTKGCELKPLYQPSAPVDTGRVRPLQV